MGESVTVEKVSPRDFASAVADEIVASIGEQVEDHGRCTVVLAGGGTPSNVYRLLSRPPRISEIDWPKVHLFWGDERWVPGDDLQSNYRMVQETLLSFVAIPAGNVHPIDTSLATPEQSAQDYERRIRGFLGVTQGVPVFDLMLLGIGNDGHTASLFPGSAALEEPGAVCRAVDAPGGQGHRVSLCPDVLVSARRLLFIVSGRDKAEVVKLVLQGDAAGSPLPARRILAEARGRVTCFLDTEASLQLEG